MPATEVLVHTSPLFTDQSSFYRDGYCRTWYLTGPQWSSVPRLRRLSRGGAITLITPD